MRRINFKCEECLQNNWEENIQHGKTKYVGKAISNKCILYQHLIHNVCLQYYFTKPINHVFRDVLLCLKLYIDKGCHRYIATGYTVD